MQDVIFREEYNPYTKEWGFLAVFPEDPARKGYICVLPFCFRGDTPWFESLDEADISYVLSKKIVHKNDERVPKLLEALEKYCDDTFRVVEKITDAHRRTQNEIRREIEEE